MRPALAGAWCLLVACAEPSSEVAPTATELLRLPKTLREVSGIVAVFGDRLLCVQDEVGALFPVSLSGESMPPEPFGPKGDYEGLALVGATPWVLRSDGVLLELGRVAAGWQVTRTVRLPDRYTDWEGLCWDEAGERLLVMPKDRAGQDKAQRDERPVFAVDPKRGEVAPKPALVLSRKALSAAAGAGGHGLSTRTDQFGQRQVELELTCSELCLVPGKRELLLLSAVDHLLLRVDLEGRLLATRLLDRELLPQPEGMTFLADGRLVVASEGDGGRGRLAVVVAP